jgi:hypothetical protein
MKRKSPPNPNTDEYGLLAAIWILSCNDQIAYMTYEGIKYRLGLSGEYDLRGLVASRGELFRAKVPQNRLDQWKREMLTGEHLPSWIREKDKSERQVAIERLTPEDLFRNQFRTEANAPRAQLEIITWGLEHIETIRRAGVENREERTKRWTSFRIPLLSTIVALVAVIGGSLLQWANIQSQRQTQLQTLDFQKQLKYYEVELKPKLEGYSSLINAMLEMLRSAEQGDTKQMSSNEERVRLALYSLEPFLSPDRRQEYSSNMGAYVKQCSNVAVAVGRATSDRKESRLVALRYLVEYKDNLAKDLFGH